jgi:predicted nuclease of restriction endonuclease-like (RecB) superfamily
LTARNIWRMKKFYDTYSPYPKLSTLLTEIGWSNHLHILSKTKTIEEKEYYLMLAAKRNYSARDLARLIDSSTFERTVLANQKLSTVLIEFPENTVGVFKDTLYYQTKGKGCPIFLISGANGDYKSVWPNSVVDTLAEHFQVIQFDNRGVGRVAKLTDNRNCLTWL